MKYKFSIKERSRLIWAAVFTILILIILVFSWLHAHQNQQASPSSETATTSNSELSKESSTSTETTSSQPESLSLVTTSSTMAISSSSETERPETSRTTLKLKSSTSRKESKSETTVVSETNKQLELPKTLDLIPKYENEKENSELKTLIENHLKSKKINPDDVAVDFHHLDKNETFSINEDSYYIAASTYKLALACIYYDLLDQGLVMPDDAYPYLEDITAGSLENEFNCGDDVPVKALLYHMIRYSDNTASHILFDHLGGWREYKDIASNYVDVLKDSDFLSRENIIKANYLSQYLRLIYEHQNMYTELLKDMLAAEPENYLNLEESMHNKLYQKYGFYMSACNSAGLNLEDGNNYSIVVLTRLGEQGEAIIGEISELVYNYYHPEKQKTKNAVIRSGKD